ncbi:MAG: ABC transporter ATP-binding protein [Flavobacteriales bacterium]|nr:ABC transporter ATP-binding protein [Flavobacteriales bacterium]
MNSRKTVIKVEHLTKRYRLGVFGSGTLREDISQFISKLKGKEADSNIIGPRSNEKGDFWALRDINFEVVEGEILGIIGKNGAGKSTLLKILSQITSPTQGEIKLKGRVASLLEVGTGFHPELTGRENIFLNGAILGMTKSEIRSKLDEIISFSGIEHHIDTPVKRYSSGMKVRLGFAVAAHLEPEILVIDEVLAVGDADFQKKCLGKMKDVSQSGRTVLFVSHNMTAVRSLCTRCVLLEEGKLIFDGSPDSAVSKYLGGEVGQRKFHSWELNSAFGNENCKLISIQVVNFSKESDAPISMDDMLGIEISYHLSDIKDRHDFTLQFKGPEGEILFATGTGGLTINQGNIGYNKAVLKVPENLFNSGTIEVNLLMVKNRREVITSLDSILSFTIVDGQKEEGQWLGKAKGYFAPKLDWKIENSSIR